MLVVTSNRSLLVSVQITPHDHSIIACLRHIHIGAIVSAHHLRGASARSNTAPTEWLQQWHAWCSKTVGYQSIYFFCISMGVYLRPKDHNTRNSSSTQKCSTFTLKWEQASIHTSRECRKKTTWKKTNKQLL